MHGRHELNRQQTLVVKYIQLQLVKKMTIIVHVRDHWLAVFPLRMRSFIVTSSTLCNAVTPCPVRAQDEPWYGPGC